MNGVHLDAEMSEGPSIVVAPDPGGAPGIPPLPQGTLEPEKVPEAVKPEQVSMLRIFLPLIMVTVVIGMVGLMVLSGGSLNPYMLIFPLMMGMSMLMMFAPQPGEDIDAERRAYLRHLSAFRRKASRNAQAQRSHMTRLYPAAAQLWSEVGTPRMWSRAAESPQALAVRVGLGAAPLCTPISVSDSGATEDLDPVCAVSLRQVVKASATVPDIPVVVQLKAFEVIAIHGPRARGLARSLVAQLAFHHGPECLGLRLHGDCEEEFSLLPHADPRAHPSYRVGVFDGKQANDPIAMEGFDCVIAVDPAPQSQVAQWAEDSGLVLHAGQFLEASTEGGKERLGTPEVLSRTGAQGFSRALTCYVRPQGSSSTSNDLRRLLGVENFDVATLDQLWRPRGRKALAVPIGLSQAGTPLVLDIKESAYGGMGPHGLCVGATGSGKASCSGLLWWRWPAHIRPMI